MAQRSQSKAKGWQQPVLLLLRLLIVGAALGVITGTALKWLAPQLNTDVPLPFCYVYDVTGAAERKAFKPPDPTGDFLTDFVLSALGYHNWPLAWLALHCETVVRDGKVINPSHEQKPRGEVVRVA